jgi:hypothetical protein
MALPNKDTLPIFSNKNPSAEEINGMLLPKRQYQMVAPSGIAPIGCITKSPVVK